MSRDAEEEKVQFWSDYGDGLEKSVDDDGDFVEAEHYKKALDRIAWLSDELDKLRNRFGPHLLVEGELKDRKLIEHINDVPPLIDDLQAKVKELEDERATLAWGRGRP